MTETILVGLISAASVLAGVCVTSYFEMKRRQSEERRWLADHFLHRKIEALSKLYAELVDCHFTLKFYAHEPPKHLDEYKAKVQPREEAYLRALVMAKIYLEPEYYKIMSKALGSFRQVTMAIWLKLPAEETGVNREDYSKETRDVNWKCFTQSYDEANARLGELLDPKTIEGYLRSIS